MRKKITIFYRTIMVQIIFASFSYGGGGTTGGASLLEAKGARSVSLGESFSAIRNDVNAFEYNPAALKSLETAQASIDFQRGLTEDYSGRIIVGIPNEKHGSMGISIGYKNAGNIEIFDGVTDRTVQAKTDMVANLGWAKKIKSFGIGFSGKYLSTTYLETQKWDAFAADMGIQYLFSSRINLGAAFQNFGSRLNYSNQKYNLPRIARAGLSILMIPGENSMSLYLETPYFLNESTLKPSIGLEAKFGPMALRAGFKNSDSLQDLSIGAGFNIGEMSLDYAYGLADKLNSTHLVSLTFKLGISNENKNNILFIQNSSISNRGK